MRHIYIPGACPKCEHELSTEKNHDHSGAAYCSRCDFILNLTKEEFAQIEDLYEN